MDNPDFRIEVETHRNDPMRSTVADVMEEARKSMSNNLFPRDGTVDVYNNHGYRVSAFIPIGSNSCSVQSGYTIVVRQVNKEQ